MANSIFEQILQGFVTQGQTITTANGYNYTAASVIRSITNIDEDDIPSVAIFPGEEEVERVTARVMLNRTVLIEMKVPIDDENPSVVQEKAMADVIQCFTRTDQRTWRALADSVEYVGGGPQGPPSEGQKYTGILARFTVKYKIIKGNPYQQ